MIIRIVKMTFQEEAIPTFLELFDQQRDNIRAFEGCEYLELWQDSYDPRICFTCSYWVDEEALQVYRHSALFQQTWQQAKVLFADKPQAWTLQRKG